MILLATAPAATAAQAGAVPPREQIVFTDIAVPGTALDLYRRTPSPEHARSVANLGRPYITRDDFAAEGVHTHGVPGVVLLDHDGDGDTDVFVTNGPGTPNSLFRNELEQTGRLVFTDTAAAAGVALTDLDANGACAGDVDNDRDPDLYVLGRNAGNHLLRNEGDGTFADVTGAAGDAAAGTLSHLSCTMADVDNDGLLDIAVANAYDMKTALPILRVPWALNQPNQLLRNAGGGAFADVSTSSGFAPVKVDGRVPDPAREEITWSVTAADYDQDGDADLLTASHQALVQPAKYGGADRGFVRVYRNDGTGHFEDVTMGIGLAEWGGWSGTSFGDFNFDGTLDFFATNTGDYMKLPVPGLPHQYGDQSSRWFLQRPDGTFVDVRRGSVPTPRTDNEDADPTLGGLGTTPWGWGTSTLDYDNDGLTDVLFHGSIDGMNLVTADNPGMLLHNRGPAGLRKGFFPSFDYDAAARSATDHRRRSVTGMAVGDLNRDGFPDVVSAAQSIKVGELTRYADIADIHDWSPVFTDDARFLEVYHFDGSVFRPTGAHTVEGDLSVEVNGGNGNRSATVRTLGSVGVTPAGGVNRDGVGALVRFTPRGGPTAMHPVSAGTSYGSQDAHETTFGMGTADTAVVEVLWPGGVRNRLYGVRAGERVTFPEIPCRYDDPAMTRRGYWDCVTGALGDLVDAGHLSRTGASRFLISALRAFHDAR
ncbi:CRTAC1 family protein [Saccharothrix syringae]|uniref:CRTAC1 family protein n=1 Tax=Saccharothrix syringae TaxID=103733 RepID=UPI0005240D29|nr:CRTAC1 family protein [Saccharothrix syringae]